MPVRTPTPEPSQQGGGDGESGASERQRKDLQTAISLIQNPHSCKIQVSLVPPPWLELTTSEPSFSATRVSPPGTMVVRSRPVSTNGLRSTWRGARPFSVQVGQVES